MALTPAETTFVATHEVPVVTAMKPYLNDAREAANLLAPTNTQPPVITGSGAVGSPLHATSGVWTGTPYPTLTYQWKADGVNIAGATSANYTPVVGDIGKTITCTVTATNSHGSVSVTTNGIVIAAADSTPPTALTFSPLDNATGVAVGTDLVVTISETVVLGTGVVTLKKTSDNSTVKAWNVATDGGSVAGKVEVVGGTALTLHLAVAMANSTEHYVVWDAGVVKDAANNPIAAQASTTLWSFTTVASSFTGLLDTYPTASMAYSFRKLRGGYAGSAVRIRRSSDNLELNVGFLANGNFDSAAAAAHIGGGTGFIVTWFDQSGNGIDVTQATAASQPTYSATGMNALPTMTGAGTQYLERASVAYTVMPVATTTIMLALKDPNGARNFFGWNTAQTSIMQLVTAAGSFYFDFADYVLGRVNVAEPGGWTTGSHLLELGREVGNGQFITVDGVELARASKTAVLSSGTAAWDVGAQSGGTTAFVGSFSELVIWAADLAANRTAARANITSYWLPPAFTGLLDTYPTASMAYSFRKLRNAYAGSAVRIRRSSDNAELNVGFLANGDFDSAAAATHIGGGTGFIVTWFDQSGNGLDVTDATAANQPTYSATGMLSKPTMTLDGNDYLSKASVANTALPISTTTIMGVLTTAAGTNQAVKWIGTASTNLFEWFPTWAGSSIYFDFGNDTAGSGRTQFSLPGGIDGSAHLHEAGRTVGNAQFSTIDGVQIGSTASITAVPTAGTGPFTVSGYLAGPAAASEIVIWAADLAGSRAAARSNVGTYWGTPGFGTTLLLDALGVSATRAYSTRKLRSAYAGSAIRIRRSSDNAEQDIGFSGEDLDTAAITTFVGANSAYVVTMYDQSGSADDLVQATSGLQPRIVNAGTLDVRNTKACPLYDGVDDVLIGGVAQNPAEYSGLVATTQAGPNWVGQLGAFGGTGGGAGGVGLLTSNGAAIYISPLTWITALSVNNTGTKNSVFGGVLQQVDFSGTPEGASLPRIGQDRLVAAYWPGWVGEVVIFGTALSAGNRTAMYTNQKTYWGTP